MNAFFKRAFNEHKRHSEIKRSFGREIETLRSIVGKMDAAERREVSLLLLFPLIEIAWANGRVASREMDAIVQAAEAYGLVREEDGFRDLIERMLSRPSPSAVGRMWQDLRNLLERLTDDDREAVVFALLLQTRFIAERSSDNFVAFLLGERICKDELEALRIVAAQLEEAKLAADNAARKDLGETSVRTPEQSHLNVGTEQAVTFTEAQPPVGEMEKLIPLVPLVKVAWAEGRITRREREMIFAAAARMGLEPDSPAHQRLSDWLELHPTDEFYSRTLEQLREELDTLPVEERTLRRLDLLTNCVSVAEASGGTSRFPAGGARVCDEERAAVRRIASRLNGRKDAALAR